MGYLETSKIRARIIQHCNGCGLDIGCQTDKIRPEAIGIDQRRYEGMNITGDANNIPALFPVGTTFDYVYSSHCLEDIKYHITALAGWAKMLRQGGLLILQVPHPTLFKGHNPDHKHPGWTPAELIVMVKQLGMEVVEAFVDDVPAENRYSSVIVAKKVC